MRLFLAVALAFVAPSAFARANTACLTDADIETALGAQIRSNAMIVTAPDLAERTLCSGLTLAQQVQRMREAAFPDERIAREARVAEQRAMQEAARAREVAQAESVARVQARQQSPENHAQRAGSAPPNDALAYFDGIIAEDAAGWMMNRYDRGSMRNMKIIESSNRGRTKVVYGDYTYNRGSAGWVKARFVNTKLECLEFWDFSGQCRPLGRSPSQGLAAGFAGALVTGMMSDTSSTRNSSGGRDDCSLKPVDTNGAGGVVYGMRC